MAKENTMATKPSNGLSKKFAELLIQGYTTFRAYNESKEYKLFNTKDLRDGTVIRTGMHSFLKVSALGGWVSYTGRIHPDEEMAQILNTRISPIHVYFN